MKLYTKDITAIGHTSYSHPGEDMTIFILHGINSRIEMIFLREILDWTGNKILESYDCCHIEGDIEVVTDFPWTEYMRLSDQRE